ncbi:hypothetical protein ANO14919_026440 [Xylariales sp. No.14919]|nr:hypothetical protein ANO14919_026440 [Xylariales sp. No.14919]
MRSSKANIGSLSSMASKVRQEKKNSASAKAKAPLVRARESKKPFKSADKVTDSSSDNDSDSSADSADSSDSDGDLDAARAKFRASEAAKQKKPAEAKANGAKRVATTPAKPLSKGSIPTSAQKSSDDSAFDSESDSGTSDSDSSSSSTKPSAAQGKSNVSKAKGKSKSSSDSTSSSGSSSDSEDEDAPSAKANPKSAAAKAQESSSEDSDNSSESDDEGAGGKTTVARTNGKDAATESTSQVSRAPWLNNSDFMLRKASSSNPGKEVADFFSNANLEGKQVWYFTAPASLPITVLKDMEIDLSKATSGGPLLTHGGDNYGLDLESYATNTQIQLLIPSQGGEKYTSLNRGIDSTVHLRRMAKFGPGGEVHATATDDYVPIPKPIREQPEGLRARYTPIGVPTPPIPSVAPTKRTTASAPSSESGSDGESDVEMTTPPASIATPSRKKSAKSDVTNGDRKRKHSGDEDQAAKRLKGGQSTEKKHNPVQALNPSDATPPKKSSTKNTDKKEKPKKAKTPKSTTMTSATAKQTPIPLPTYPGMKH